MALGIATLTSLVLGIAPAELASHETHSEDAPDEAETAQADAAEGPSPTVHRPEPQQQAKHWQIAIALSLLSRQRARFDVEPINSGVSVPGTLVRDNNGPSGSFVILEPGYVIANRLVLGLLLDFGSGYTESKIGGGVNLKLDQSTASLAIGPRVAYYFAPSSPLRPFASLAFGYGSTPNTQGDDGLLLTLYQGFAAAGLSYFATPSFSFDSAVRVAYGYASGYVDSGPLRNWALAGSMTTFLWTLGTSGWL